MIYYIQLKIEGGIKKMVKINGKQVTKEEFRAYIQTLLEIKKEQQQEQKQ